MNCLVVGSGFTKGVEIRELFSEICYRMSVEWMWVIFGAVNLSACVCFGDWVLLNNEDVVGVGNLGR